MSSIKVDNVVVDARPLQDPDYRYRGVGQHSTTLIRALREYHWSSRRPRLTALVDYQMLPLTADHTALFDDVVNGGGARSDTNSWFLSLSPMTHDPLWVAGLLTDPQIYKIALFYDLIPLEFPERYLRHHTLKSAYLTSLAWLRQYDKFACISEYTAESLLRSCGVSRSRMFVSGVALRPELSPLEASEIAFNDRRYILIAGGGDPRKNPECALRAIGASRLLQRLNLSAVVFGTYSSEARSALRAQFSQAGGPASCLQFPGHLTDAELQDLYRRALVTIVPSFAEGFSIPIIESAVSRTPVLVSDVGAHPELVRNAARRFDPDRPDQLQKMLERLAADQVEWEEAQREQENIWKPYSVEEVGKRFIRGVLDRPVATAAPRVRRAVRPRIAVLTPMPPAESGVADFSAATLKPLAQFAELHLFTDTKNVRPVTGFFSQMPVRAAGLQLGRFDRMISVIGNSDHHTSIFHHLLQYGGAAIAHDARMINFYMGVLGLQKALTVARSEYDEDCSAADLQKWLLNQRELPILFLSEVARSAAPLIVHSAVTAKAITKQYRVQPKQLPFAQYRRLPSDLLSPNTRSSIRRRIGWSPRDIVICSFGFVSDDKAPDEIIWALRLLLDWGVSARLVFCGFAHPGTAERLRKLAGDIGVLDRLQLFDTVVSESDYVSHLVATDLAVQLRTYFMGGLSGGLGDCIAAAVPTVANEHLAEAMEAPSYVVRTSDHLSPVLIAEALLDLIPSAHYKARPLDEADLFRASHSPEKYVDHLLNALDLEKVTN